MIAEVGPWTFGWEALVALTTGALALATFFLAWSARSEAKEVKRQSEAVRQQADATASQVGLQQEQARAALRAVVYPSGGAEWAGGFGPYLGRRNDVLPLTNGGPGVALNVVGRVWWHIGSDAVGRTLYGGSIGPNTSSDARVTAPPPEGWGAGIGYLTYADLNGDRWITRFRFTEGMQNALVVESEPPEPAPSAQAVARQYPPPEWSALSTAES